MTWIGDPRNPAYARAMAEKCPVCGALPGVQCWNTIRKGDPLPGRITHLGRVEAAQ